MMDTNHKCDYSLDVLSQAVVFRGIKRTFFRDLAILSNGEKASFDILVANHPKIFPDLTYIVVTAIGHNLNPIGFRDMSVNRVSASDSRCFGSGSECVPHFLSKDWHGFERGVPYRWFRLGQLNPQTKGFMVLKTHEETGLIDALVTISEDLGSRLKLKSMRFSES